MTGPDVIVSVLLANTITAAFIYYGVRSHRKELHEGKHDWPANFAILFILLVVGVLGYSIQ